MRIYGLSQYIIRETLYEILMKIISLLLFHVYILLFLFITIFFLKIINLSFQIYLDILYYFRIMILNNFIKPTKC